MALEHFNTKMEMFTQGTGRTTFDTATDECCILQTPIRLTRMLKHTKVTGKKAKSMAREGKNNIIILPLDPQQKHSTQLKQTVLPFV
jgi:hypothetical protein